MATANGSGDPRRAEADDPDRTQRIPGMQEVVDRWFPEDEPDEATQMDSRTARRMEEQRQRGQRTTGRRGCPLAGALAVAVVAVLAKAVR